MTNPITSSGSGCYLLVNASPTPTRIKRQAPFTLKPPAPKKPRISDENAANASQATSRGTGRARRVLFDSEQPTPAKPRISNVNAATLISASQEVVIEIFASTKILSVGSLTISAYDLSGRTFTIIKSTDDKKGSAACAMMMAFDQLQRINKSGPSSMPGVGSSSREINLPPEDNSLYRSLYEKGLTRADEISKALSNVGFKAVAITFQRNYDNNSQGLPPAGVSNVFFKEGKDIIGHIADRFNEDPGISIMVPVDDGTVDSWIIIDDIVNFGKDNAYGVVRYPLSGKVYNISVSKLAEIIDDGCETIKAVYIQSNPD